MIKLYLYNVRNGKEMYIRKTADADIDSAVEIYSLAREFMRTTGNPNQWVGRPDRDDVIKDIADGNGYVCVENDEVVGVFFFRIGVDKTYLKIENGEWLSDAPYAVIHRIAVKYHGRGIADFIYNEVFKMWQNVRIDTHRDNIPMQKSLTKNGFRYCGIIHLENGEERLAYQKL